MSIMKRKRAEDAADVRVTKHPNMQYAKLGNGGPEVSRCCLGTMTWGEQNTEEEAWSQVNWGKGDVKRSERGGER